MIRTTFGKGWWGAFIVVVLCGISTAAVADPAAEDGPLRGAGTPRMLMAIKSPSGFGPHLAGADVVTEEHATPQAGTFETIMAIKAPSVWGPHLAGADEASTDEQVASSGCQAGSFARTMATRLPPSARPGNTELYKDCAATTTQANSLVAR
jgi:hypothetical protein